MATVLPSGTATATSSQERRLHAMINDARGARGVNGLALSGRLSRKAHRHSRRMAASGSLFHSCLDCGRRGPGRMAENVGVGGSVGAVHRALMNSAGHRDNILGSAYARVGVGVVRRGGRVWVTELFAG